MKRLVGVDIDMTFVFDPVNKTIVFSKEIMQEQILLITNTTDTTIIYNFADPAMGGTLVGNTLTLEFNTVGMSSSDRLQVYLDVEETENPAMIDLLRGILHQLRPLGIVTGAGSNRLSLDVYSIATGTLATVTTVATVTNIRDFGGIPNGAFQHMKDLSTIAFQSIRSNIV